MESQSILIVEDNPEIQLMLSAILKSKYNIKIVTTAKEAYSELVQNSYDLLLVDVGLPDESGFQFCARIKLNEKLMRIPFIFLTAHDQTPDIVMGFSLGADDYISKPIVREQFEARVASKLRKVSDEKKNEKIIQKGDFCLDQFQQAAFVVTPMGRVGLNLTSIEFRLLKYFLDHTNHVLSREQILNDVWGQNLSVTDRTVDTHVYTLRKKLGDFAKYICTVSGVGYQFQDNVIKKAA